MKRKKLWITVGVIILILVVLGIAYMLGGFGQQTGFLPNNLPSPISIEVNDPLIGS